MRKMLSASIGELTTDLVLGVIKSDLHFVWANVSWTSNCKETGVKIIWRMVRLLKVFWITRESYPINFSKCWKQLRGLFKSMDPDSEVKKRETLTKCIPKRKDNKLTEVRIESSGSRKPRMLRKSLSKTRNCQRKGSRQNSRVDELKVVNGNRVGQNSRVDELKVVNGNRVGQVVRGLRWNLNELAKAIDGLLRDNLKESGNRKN
ncbi:hypothetical protein F2Q68_00043749 [Brassica cretica]|uniref:Uncharacterized protein n=1 Tax=Brassica cretica TaxID=69181 RepID=A0A8S9LQY5_BRACR|nr:hypothetical protein F2Q68_00043749 [Brassica cretica]